MDRSLLEMFSYISQPCMLCSLGIPSRALNAGSMSPRDAISTALITLGSTVGNASASIISACCCGESGLEGFGGGFSPAGGEVVDVEGSSWPSSANNGETGDTV